MIGGHETMDEATDRLPAGSAPIETSYRGAIEDGPDAGLMRAIIDTSPDCIKVIELDGSLSFINANGCRAMEIDDFARYRGRKWDILWPENTHGDVHAAKSAAREGKASQFEAYCPTSKGNPRWWEVSVTPIADESGRPARIVSVSRDITERIHRENQLRLHEIELNQLAEEQAGMLRDQKADMEANDVLMREVDHRMKNSLAMLGSLLKMETRRVSDETARKTLQAAASRVATIASVHERLYRGTEKDTLALRPYLDALVRDLVSSMAHGVDGPPVSTEIDADDVSMRGGKALALGLLTVELVMNAIRHGSRDGACSVRVECRQHGDAMKLTVADRGDGLPDDFDPSLSKGLGMRVVQSSVAKLQGELTFSNRADRGAQFEVAWPA